MADTDTPRPPGAARFLVTTAAFIVVVAGMKTASAIIVPFLLAAFLAVICLPAMSAMRRARIPAGLAILLIVLAIVAIFTLLGTFVGASVNSFIRELPTYEARLTEKAAALVRWLDEMGANISVERMRASFNPGTAMRMIGNTLASLSGMLTNAFMIILTVVFILLEAAGFGNKLRAAVPNPEKSMAQVASIRETLNRYLALKTLFSFVTGLLIFFWLTFLDVDYPVLWGLVAFLFNFIPNIGSIIAAIPAVLLAVVQYDLGRALAVAAGYLVVNFAIGSVAEPRLMGRGLGLSTLVVFLSLVFWGWVLGPVGMLLSVPLTMVLKIIMESNDDTRGLAIMLGPADPRGAPTP